MAVSKTQNERPAIVALIDAVNMAEPIVAQNVRNIAMLTENLDDEITNRESADTQLQSVIEREVLDRGSADTNIQNQLGSEITNRENADTDLQNQIGYGMFSPSFTITNAFQQSVITLSEISDNVSTLKTWQNLFRLGLTQSVTAPAGGSASGTVIFGEPFGKDAFGNDAKVAVFPTCVNGSANLADLSCKVTSADYSGFSFAVNNASQASATVEVGFLAVRMN